jgi:hypothetical protein
MSASSPADPTTQPAIDASGPPLMGAAAERSGSGAVRLAWLRRPLAEPLHRQTLAAIGLEVAVLIAAATYLGRTDGSPSAGLIAGLLAAGVLTWTLAEYVMHRVLFHLPHEHPLAPLGAHAHGEHHAAPDRAPITKPLRLTLPPIAIVALAAGVAGGAAGLWFVAGAVLGYFGYEWLHVSAHVLTASEHPWPATQRHHLEHHRDARKYFGITSPLWDKILRT